MSPTKTLGRYKRYPTYKDSGVDWLGEIPAHWNAPRLKFHVDVNPPSRHSASEASFVPMEAVGEYGGLDLDRTIAVDDASSGYTVFLDNDVVVAKITPCFENGKGALAAGLTNGVALGTTELHVLRAGEEVDPRFLMYVAFSHPFRKRGEGEMYGAGGQKRVPDSFISNHRQPLPPRAEQQAIVSFLDRQTAEIDSLAQRKSDLLTMLQEVRSSLISDAVTKGVQPGVPMKRSEVEWLGRVPIHWGVERIKWCAKLVSGHTPDKKIESYWQGGDVPWLSLADTNRLRENDYLDSTSVSTTADGLANSSAHVLPVGTVVFSRDASVGLCGITRVGMAVSQHFIGWICGPRLLPEYLLFVLRSMTAELERLTMGATVKTIGMPDVKSLVAPIPPMIEQRQIVREVFAKRARLDASINTVTQAIAKLKELRAALISAAVTGQIDVRGEVA